MAQPEPPEPEDHMASAVPTGWTQVRLATVPATPWRNGGGVTRELLAWPRADEWRVRLSVAEVAQDGPFSRFDGVQRWFAVLDGAGVQLEVGGQRHTVTADGEPLAFDGGAAVGCTLVGGPTRDFNLMSRGLPAQLGRVGRGLDRTLAAGSLVAVYAHAAAAVAKVGPQALEVTPFTLAWRILGPGATLHVAGEDALWMEAVLGH